jgi:hypothetical protein
VCVACHYGLEAKALDVLNDFFVASCNGDVVDFIAHHHSLNDVLQHRLTKYFC